MKKQIENQLKELATAILRTENFSAQELKEKAQLLYEQATLLAYAEKNETIENTTFEEEATEEPQIETQKIEEKVEEAIVETPQEKELEEFETFGIEESVLDMSFEPSVDDTTEKQEIEVTRKPEEEIETIERPIEAPALLHELENLTKDFDLPDFEPVEVLKEEKPVSVSTPPSEIVALKPKISLNDRLNKGFQVGLNDRLAFVNQLFGGDQQDYTRVISQLNTTETLSEAQQFINEIVKPEYNNWEGKEAFEIRFLDLVERNFQE